MKVIFLDVDGVLNCSDTEEIFYMTFVSPQKIELLKELVDRTGAKVVLSSTWRYGWLDVEKGLDSIVAKCFIALKQELEKYDITLLDYTPITNYCMNNRGGEISFWLAAHADENIESYVILDDTCVDFLSPHEKHLVHTSEKDGLLQEHVNHAIEILNQ